jgi:hypothetical protein
MLQVFLFHHQPPSFESCNSDFFVKKYLRHLKDDFERNTIKSIAKFQCMLTTSMTPVFTSQLEANDIVKTQFVKKNTPS